MISKFVRGDEGDVELRSEIGPVVDLTKPHGREKMK